MEEETHLVHPEPGVTLYAPGHRVPFEAGRPVPLPRAHAEALLASGHVRLHVPPAPAPEALWFNPPEPCA